MVCRLSGAKQLSAEFSHHNYIIMSAMTYQITSLIIVYWSVYSGADQRKHQGSVSLAFVRGIHRWPMNSPHKGPVTRKMFSVDDVMVCYWLVLIQSHRVTTISVQYSSIFIHENAFENVVYEVKDILSQLWCVLNGVSLQCRRLLTNVLCERCHWCMPSGSKPPMYFLSSRRQWGRFQWITHRL